MKKDQVIEFMNSLEKSDKKLASFVKLYEALSSFLTDFDFLKDTLGLTQKDIAEKMGTTQSAISRIASLKTNPSYKQLQKMAEAVGGELLVTPMKSMTVQVPYDLQETVRKLATSEKKSTSDYLEGVLRNAIELERSSYMHRTLALSKRRSRMGKIFGYPCWCRQKRLLESFRNFVQFFHIPQRIDFGCNRDAVGKSRERNTNTGVKSWKRLFSATIFSKNSTKASSSSRAKQSLLRTSPGPSTRLSRA